MGWDYLTDKHLTVNQSNSMSSNVEADPGFPSVESVNPLFGQNVTENCLKMKKIGPSRGWVQTFSMYIRHWNGSLTEIVCFDFRAVWWGSDKKLHLWVFFHMSRYPLESPVPPADLIALSPGYRVLPDLATVPYIPRYTRFALTEAATSDRMFETTLPAR